MTFEQALKICLTKYASPFGRASRKEFWYFMLFYMSGWIIISIAYIAAFAAYAAYETDEPTTPLIIVSTIAAIWSNITFVPAIAVAVRRLHDIGKSGWWWWLSITIVGLIPLVIWYARKTENKKNKYGENPLKQKKKTTKFEKIEFFDAIKIAFDKYSDFDGRATRSEFWYFMIFSCILGQLLADLLAIASNAIALTIVIVLIVASLIFVFPSITVTVRRLHDVGKSGWWWWLYLTIIGYIPLIIWYARKGENKKNKYGAKLSG